MRSCLLLLLTAVALPETLSVRNLVEAVAKAVARMVRFCVLLTVVQCIALTASSLHWIRGHAWIQIRIAAFGDDCIRVTQRCCSRRQRFASHHILNAAAGKTQLVVLLSPT